MLNTAYHSLNNKFNIEANNFSDIFSMDLHILPLPPYKIVLSRIFITKNVVQKMLYNKILIFQRDKDKNKVL